MSGPGRATGRHRGPRPGPARRRPVASVAAVVAVTIAAPAAASLAWAAFEAVKVYRGGLRSARPVLDDAGRPRPGIPPDPEAIVVFGATATAAGPSEVLRARLEQAALLWRAGVAPVIVATGGVAHGVDEVDVMSDWLVADGIPARAVAPGRPGQNTRGSVRTIARLGYRRVVAVSTPFHAERIEEEGRRCGVAIATSSPSSIPPTIRGRFGRSQFVSEVAALLWYALPPWLAARVYTGPGSLRQVVPQVLAGEMRALDAVRGRLGRSRG